MSGKLEKHDISGEQFREYDFGGRVYGIRTPKTLYCRRGGSTHRVVDEDGLVHCVPAPGRDGCVLRWRPKNGEEPVWF